MDTQEKTALCMSLLEDTVLREMARIETGEVVTNRLCVRLFADAPATYWPWHVLRAVMFRAERRGLVERTGHRSWRLTELGWDSVA